jgi:hypothetical protein
LISPACSLWHVSRLSTWTAHKTLPRDGQQIVLVHARRRARFARRVLRVGTIPAGVQEDLGIVVRLSGSAVSCRSIETTAHLGVEEIVTGCVSFCMIRMGSMYHSPQNLRLGMVRKSSPSGSGGALSVGI